jgi:hypothetical protein
MSAAAAPAPRPRRRWIWVIVAMLTALVVVPPFAARIWLKADLQHQTEQVPVAARPVTAVQVDSPGGSVSISQDPGSHVTMSSTASWLVRKPVVRQAWHGRTLQVGTSCPRLDPFEDCQENLVVQVPAGITVQVDVGSGSVSAQGLTGPLHLRATSGAFTLTDVRGPVWASVTSGSVTAQGLRSARLHASARSGSLALDFDSPPQLLALTVGSGSASATVPPGTRYRVSVRAGPGSVQVQPGLRDGTSAQVITATVGSGSLAIAYPAG